MLAKIPDIISFVEEWYGFSAGSLFEKDRSSTLAEARQIAMYLCHKLTERSTVEIGNSLYRHHTTIIHGIRTVKRRMDKEPAFKRRVSEFTEYVSAPKTPSLIQRI